MQDLYLGEEYLLSEYFKRFSFLLEITDVNYMNKSKKSKLKVFGKVIDWKDELMVDNKNESLKDVLVKAFISIFCLNITLTNESRLCNDNQNGSEVDYGCLYSALSNNKYLYLINWIGFNFAILNIRSSLCQSRSNSSISQTLVNFSQVSTIVNKFLRCWI